MNCAGVLPSGSKPKDVSRADTSGSAVISRSAVTQTVWMSAGSRAGA